MAKPINILSFNFKNWECIEENHQQIAVSPSWKNGWTKTFFYVKDNALHYENVSLIWRSIDWFGWYRHLNKNDLWEGLKAQSIIPIDAKCPTKEDFRKILGQKLQAYSSFLSPEFQKEVQKRIRYLLQMHSELMGNGASSSSVSGSQLDERIRIFPPVLLEAVKRLENGDFSNMDLALQRVIEMLMKIHRKKLTSDELLIYHNQITDENEREFLIAVLQSSSLKEFSEKIKKLDFSFLYEGLTPLNLLPAEILFHIFSFCGGFQLKCLSLVCQLFNGIVNCPVGFVERYKLRGYSVKKIASYAHLRHLGSFLNQEFARVETRIGNKNPLLFAQFKKGSIFKLDKEGCYKADIEFIESTTARPTDRYFQAGFKPISALHGSIAMYNNALVSPFARPHNRYVNGSCYPIICDWTQNLLIMTAVGQSAVLALYSQKEEVRAESIAFDSPISSLHMTKRYSFVGYQSGYCEIFKTDFNDFSSLGIRLNCQESAPDEVVHIQTFRKESRLLTVTQKGICKIWKLGDSVNELEASFVHSEKGAHKVNFSKILGDAYLLTADTEGNCKLTNMKTKEFFLLKHDAPVQASTRFCQTLFIASNDKKIILWDMNNGAKLTEYNFDFEILDMFLNKNCLAIIGTNDEAALITLHFNSVTVQTQLHADRLLNSV